MQQSDLAPDQGAVYHDLSLALLYEDDDQREPVVLLHRAARSRGTNRGPGNA